MIGWLRRRFRPAPTPEPLAPLPAVPRSTEELRRAQEEHDRQRILVEALRLASEVLAELAQKRKGSA